MRSVGWISFCLVSCICGGATAVHAQSLYDLVSQTARTASPPHKPAEPVQVPSPEPQQTDAPASPDTASSPETASAVQFEQVVQHSPPRPERKPPVEIARPKPEASWPVTLTTKAAGTGNAADGQSASADADSWSATDIASARALCAQLFKSLDVVTLPEEPIKEGPCGDPAPVRLVSIGSNPVVTLSPPPIVNCQMVEAMHRWLSKDLQPLARKHLRSPITTINVMSSYSCRNAYGRARGSLSEHARANALDIRGFVTKKGAESELLAHWGPTKKDLAEAKRLAAEKAAAAKAARLAEAQRKREARQQALAERKAERERALTAELAPPMRADTTPAITMLGATAGRFYRTLVEDETDATAEMPNKPGAMGSEAQKLGGPKVEAAVQVPEPKATIPPSAVPRRAVNTQYARFLREAHTSACRIFGTVLGPEANKAHSNHFHIDLAERNRGNYCR